MLRARIDEFLAGNKKVSGCAGLNRFGIEDARFLRRRVSHRFGLRRRCDFGNGIVLSVRELKGVTGIKRCQERMALSSCNMFYVQDLRSCSLSTFLGCCMSL